MAFHIEDWNDIKGEYDGTVLLGNGASISVDPNFHYTSLMDHAVKGDLLTTDVKSIFNFFFTDDFELILRILWQATNVNKSLKINDSKTEEAYNHVRDCLITAVTNRHSEYDNISCQLPKIYNFLKQFDTIISLNYDLIIYWTIMYGNSIDKKHAFKDCFVDSKFDDDWQKFRNPIGQQSSCSLVFYPHGNLIFARSKFEDEIKISSNGSAILEKILTKWEQGNNVPIIVSEGTKEQKIKSIQSSYYLNTVFREVLTNLSNNLVIYGWSIGEYDEHIIQRIAKSEISKIAISVFENNQTYCNRVNQLVKNEFGSECKIVFFNSESLGCWNNDAIS
ncbi:DUF4917 family protein [Sessilibacter corallicola]|uniref:DUF4917 family protein n=1 Tax=Sessilibacter corallicola TaxID=2904075 RepID=A0ABQ0A7C4_9GAMM